jgi:hypothetical protein
MQDHGYLSHQLVNEIYVVNLVYVDDVNVPACKQSQEIVAVFPVLHDSRNGGMAFDPFRENVRILRGCGVHLNAVLRQGRSKLPNHPGHAPSVYGYVLIDVEEVH